MTHLSLNGCTTHARAYMRAHTQTHQPLCSLYPTLEIEEPAARCGGRRPGGAYESLNPFQTWGSPHRPSSQLTGKRPAPAHSRCARRGQDRDEHPTPRAHVGAPAAGAGKPRPGQSREAAPQPRALTGLFSWPFLLFSAFRGHPSLHSSASATDPPPPGDPAIAISSSYHGFFPPQSSTRAPAAARVCVTGRDGLRSPGVRRARLWSAWAASAEAEEGGRDGAGKGRRCRCGAQGGTPRTPARSSPSRSCLAVAVISYSLIRIVQARALPVLFPRNSCLSDFNAPRAPAGGSGARERGSVCALGWF